MACAPYPEPFISAPRWIPEGGNQPSSSLPASSLSPYLKALPRVTSTQHTVQSLVTISRSPEAVIPMDSPSVAPGGPGMQGLPNITNFLGSLTPPSARKVQSSWLEGLCYCRHVWFPGARRSMNSWTLASSGGLPCPLGDV